MLGHHFIPRVLQETGDDYTMLVFVHGFLGDHRDWQVVCDLCVEYHRLLIDLPGHGLSRDRQCANLYDAGFQVVKTIECAINNQRLNKDIPVYLVGYSLGARILMSYLCDVMQSKSTLPDDINIAGLVLEGGHFGLASQCEKTVRLADDQKWAQRLQSQPIAEVLHDWYQQPVFSSLNHAQRQDLIRMRSDNLGENLALMLMRTSLGQQSNVLDSINSLQFNNNKPLYISGDKDRKFTDLAATSQLTHRIIDGAGHNVHHEQPRAFAQALNDYIRTTPNH